MQKLNLIGISYFINLQYTELTSTRLQISLDRSLKLHGLTCASDHFPPFVKSPPQYRLAIRASVPSVILPHGHLTSATSPMLVSGHGILMFKSGFPEDDVISVLLARHPSVILKKEL